MQTRRTDRAAYSTEPISSEFTKEAENYAANYPKCTLSIIEDPSLRSSIAAILLGAGIKLFAWKAFREELFHHMHSNATRSKTGMTGFGFGVPMVPSYIAPFFLRFFNMSKINRKADQKLFEAGTPAFLIIAVAAEVPESWINVGRIFAHIALLGTKYGIRFSPYAAGIESPDHQMQLKKVLSTQTLPAFIARMGQSKNPLPHPTPRLSVAEFYRS
jgi:hypothetical protein